jgi:hypothetical protein
MEGYAIETTISSFIKSYIEIQQLPKLPHNDAYRKMSNAMLDCYEFHKKNPDIRLYEVMQGIDEDVFTKMNETELEEFLGFERLFGDTWWMVETEIRQDYDWYYMKAKKRDETYKIGPSYIKVTISAKDDYGIKIFLAIIEELLAHGQNEFQGKLTKHPRMETMVFWVNRSEFDLIESFVKRYDDVLITPLVFMGYRGKLAISRDLYGVGSHNFRQSELMTEYFDFVDDKEEISLEGMYQFLIDSWSGVVGNSDKKRYEDRDGQVLIILLESLFVALGEHKITDNHIFMQQDREIWEPLGMSYTPKQYKEKIESMKLWKSQHPKMDDD